ncbi:MAG: M28 family peptidase [Anaerolineae bacterium]|nr:M28 family peptidase [Anaerolineae bacterium]
MTCTLSPLPNVPPRPRRRWPAVAVALALAAALLGAAVAQPPAARDPVIADMMARMTGATLMRYVSELSGETVVYLGDPPAPKTLMTRYSRSPQIDDAAQYLVEFYRRIGLSVEVQRFGDGNWPNVIATLSGATEPGKIIILCAHFDDISEQPMEWAPGADDNASGTAVVMAAAEILRHYTFAYTIRFVHFSGEEQGMIGSQAYAQLQRAANADIVGVLNLDMLAWDSNAAPIMELHAGMREDSYRVALTFAGVIADYGLPLEPEIKRAGSINASDHSSFWAYGYPAVLAIEDWQDFNAHYHTTGDRASAFNVPYYTAMARAGLGTIAVLAGVLGGPPPTPTPTPVWPSLPYRLILPLVML